MFFFCACAAADCQPIYVECACGNGPDRRPPTNTLLTLLRICEEKRRGLRGLELVAIRTVLSKASAIRRLDLWKGIGADGDDSRSLSTHTHDIVWLWWAIVLCGFLFRRVVVVAAAVCCGCGNFETIYYSCDICTCFDCFSYFVCRSRLAVPANTAASVLCDDDSSVLTWRCCVL